MLFIAVFTLLLCLLFAGHERRKELQTEEKVTTMLKRLNYSLEDYRLAHGQKDYPKDLTFLRKKRDRWINFPEVLPGQLSIRKLGYKFTYLPGAPDADGHISEFDLSAAPLPETGRASRRAFVTGEGGTIYIDKGKEFGRVDPDDEPVF